MIGLIAINATQVSIWKRETGPNNDGVAWLINRESIMGITLTSLLCLPGWETRNGNQEIYREALIRLSRGAAQAGIEAAGGAGGGSTVTTPAVLTETFAAIPIGSGSITTTPSHTDENVFYNPPVSADIWRMHVEGSFREDPAWQGSDESVILGHGVSRAFFGLLSEPARSSVANMIRNRNPVLGRELDQWGRALGMPWRASAQAPESNEEVYRTRYIDGIIEYFGAAHRMEIEAMPFAALAALRSHSAQAAIAERTGSCNSRDYAERARELYARAIGEAQRTHAPGGAWLGPPVADDVPPPESSPVPSRPRRTARSTTRDNPNLRDFMRTERAARAAAPRPRRVPEPDE